MKAIHIQPNTSGEVKNRFSLATLIFLTSIGFTTSFVGLAQEHRGDRGRDDNRGREENRGRNENRGRGDNHDNRGNGRESANRNDNHWDRNAGNQNRNDNYGYDNRRGEANRRPVIVNQQTVIYRNNTPNWRYASLPRRNSVVSVVPHTSISVSFGGINFRYDNGVYYRPYQNSYVVAPPPIGLRVNFLPPRHRVFTLYSRPYHYYNGTFYEYINNDYIVVAPPIGALVESIPAGYEKLQIDGDTYYIVDGVQYRAVLQNGEIWYEVIKIM